MKFINKVFFCILFQAVSLQAQTELPSVFGDNMVLQQKEKVAIWGKDTPKTKISILTSWGVSKTTISDDKGFWRTFIKTKNGAMSSFFMCNFYKCEFVIPAKAGRMTDVSNLH